jgi:hypothetical protein
VLTGPAVDELPDEPLVPVETGVAALELELEVPLVPVVTGAAAVGELAVALDPVVTGGAEATDAVGAAGAGAEAAAGLAPAGGLAPATGWWRTLWIVRRTTWVRTFGRLAADVVAVSAPFELRA